MPNYESYFSFPPEETPPSAVTGSEYAAGYRETETSPPRETTASTPDSSAIAPEVYGRVLGQVVSNSLAWQRGKGIKTVGDSVATFIEKNHKGLEPRVAEQVFAGARQLSAEQQNYDEEEFIKARNTAEGLLQAAGEVQRLIGRAREGDTISEQSLLGIYDSIRTASLAHGAQSVAVFGREQLRREEQRALRHSSGHPSVNYVTYSVPSAY